VPLSFLVLPEERGPEGLPSHRDSPAGVDGDAYVQTYAKYYRFMRPRLRRRKGG
jgi:hypothetical protein